VEKLGFALVLRCPTQVKKSHPSEAGLSASGHQEKKKPNWQLFFEISSQNVIRNVCKMVKIYVFECVCKPVFEQTLSSSCPCRAKEFHSFRFSSLME